jgi:hypothetical protein
VVPQRDWVEWHDEYERPGSSLVRRLEIVQRRIVGALDAAPPGPIAVVSMCAGQGRDLIGATSTHPRRDDVRARLVELDRSNVGIARRAAAAHELHGFEVVPGDASLTSAYEGAVPAHLVLVCGVFGNISDDDIRRTIRHLPMLCRPGAVVIWTRHRREPDLTPTIRRWFAERSFEELAFDTEPGYAFGVGTCRLVGDPAVFSRDVRLFAFVGDGSAAAF